jgi:peptidyl-tRNA hydrolase, PTH2 family
MIKQVIVLRTDLNMRKGKIASQAAHAAMKVFFDRGFFRADPIRDEFIINVNKQMREWMEGAFAKIVLGVRSEEDLNKLLCQAMIANLPCALITDSGKTEFHGEPTKTAIAIGPADAEAIDKITKDGDVETRLL